jgi:hypothetical protein
VGRLVVIVRAISGGSARPGEAARRQTVVVDDSAGRLLGISRKGLAGSPPESSRLPVHRPTLTGWMGRWAVGRPRAHGLASETVKPLPRCPEPGVLAADSRLGVAVYDWRSAEHRTRPTTRIASARRAVPSNASASSALNVGLETLGKPIGQTLRD